MVGGVTRDILSLDDLAERFRATYDDNNDRRQLIRTEIIPFNVEYLGTINARALSTLGNHYHSTKEEMIYVAKGKVIVSLEDIKLGRKAIGELVEGEGILIKPGIAHSIDVIEESVLIELCNKPLREVIDDVEPYIIKW